MSADFHIVIPARHASSRLPGKPLRPLAGRPLIEHVYRRAEAAGARTVTVATDDERIFDCVREFGGNAVLTAGDHASGSDRVAEAVAVLGVLPDEVVVNLQGDAPLVEPAHIQAVAERALESDVATLASPLSDTQRIKDPNVVKVVLDAGGQALYFSRAPIPARHPVAGHAPRYLRHTGLYAYRRSVLEQLAAAPQCELERVEGLEQLRALWLGLKVSVACAETPPGPEVDTPEDLRRVEKLLRSV